MQYTRDIINTINSLSYEDKAQVYSGCFSTGVIGSGSINDKLILISLISLTHLKLKSKNPTIKPIDILKQITNTNDPDKDSAFYQLLETLSLVVDDFAFGCNEADSCGLSSSKEIINKIKEFLTTWTPF